ncbi:MAG: hypothetical protein V3U38_01365 [Gemmatimonadota bacterium]
MGRGRLTHALALALVAANAQACTRDPDLFEAVDHDENVGGSPAQLTFSSVNDRSPAWSAAGDSIYYSAEGGGHLPPDRGVLVGIPVAGGVSERILTNAQLEGDGLEHWLVTPALAPDGESLAFVEILSLWDPHPCVLGLTVLFCLPISDEADVRRPPVRQIALHARRFDATEPLETDPTLTLFMPGVTLDTVPNPPLNDILRSNVRNYPYQQLFVQEQAFSFRTTWSPAGEVVAFSDGIGIRFWNVGADTSVFVSGTEDGVWPAWSPDGQWIAFSRLERADSTNTSCVYSGGFGPVCSQERTDFIIGAHRLSLVRPDGSEVIDLGEGDEPAWSPDGSTIFFRRADQIWRSAADGSGAVAILGSENGREPAISPDGQFLAFSKLNASGDYDIWVFAL